MNQLPQDKNAPIAIIGAGPSGLHMATLLRKRGYNNVQLFEKSSRFGGKTLSRTENEVANELGTTGFEVVRNSPLLELIKEVSDDEPHFTISTLKLVKNSHMPFLPDSFSKRVRFLVRHFYTVFKLLRVLKKLRCRGFPYGVDESDREMHALLGDSLLHFLQKNGFDGLINIVSRWFAAYGYGRLDEMPSYYGLLLLEKNFFSSPVYLKFERGNDILWKRIVEKFQLNIQCSCELTAIDTAHYAQSNTVELTFNKGKSSFSGSFSAVFVTVPYAISNLLPEEEKKIFQEHTVYPYAAIMATLDKARHDTHIFDYPEEAPQHLDFELMVLINFGRLVESKYRTELPSIKEFTCLLSSRTNRKISREDLIEKFSADLGKKFGTRDLSLITTQIWETYCPMLSRQQITKGAHSRLMSRQGTRGLWYIGSSLSGELVSLVTEFNHYILERHCAP